MTDLVAVDWSGAQVGSTRHIWLAHVHRGELVELANGRTRAQVAQYLIDLKRQCPMGLIVGLDFSFSLPAWFVRHLGHRSAVELWQQVSAEGEKWLAACAPPFWGKPGTRRPLGTEEIFRRTEKRAVVAGITAKSTFQLRGPGSVGTGSIRGMPHLLSLRQAGFNIWPFDPVSPFMVVEVYPRLCTGPVIKSDPAARTHYIEGSGWPLTAHQTEQVVGSEDALDAAITALCMHHHVSDLRTLRQPTDRDELVEGMIWDPHKIPT
jgi:hypothetical protein